ncbi:DUF3902 family protein, partial [Bacillus cereus]|uniref:DUF3902 family protein n=1 Tax=Bacillus cereus TaxID=1396 RepID=UPI0018F66F89|nr:DUF3902 family protein [Bacillus cereus]
MKSALNSIMISSILAVGGIIALLFNLMGNQDWVLNWVGVLPVSYTHLRAHET